MKHLQEIIIQIVSYYPKLNNLLLYNQQIYESGPTFILPILSRCIFVRT